MILSKEMLRIKSLPHSLSSALVTRLGKPCFCVVVSSPADSRSTQRHTRFPCRVDDHHSLNNLPLHSTRAKFRTPLRWQQLQQCLATTSEPNRDDSFLRTSNGDPCLHFNILELLRRTARPHSAHNLLHPHKNTLPLSRPSATFNLSPWQPRDLTPAPSAVSSGARATRGEVYVIFSRLSSASIPYPYRCCRPDDSR